MNKYLLFLLVLVSGLTSAASYQGDDIYEVGRVYAGNNSTGHFYGGELDTSMDKNPICSGRNPMKLSDSSKEPQSGCWWIVEDKLFGYTPARKVFQFNIYLLELNDNYFNITYL